MVMIITIHSGAKIKTWARVIPKKSDKCQFNLLVFH
jgi:hypothetical protein